MSHFRLARTSLIALLSAGSLSCGEELCPVEIVKISEVPDSRSIAYPDGAAVCLCLDLNQERILVALPAFRRREMLDEFTRLETGSVITVKLTPWTKRPDQARGMFIANDFADLFDLVVFWGAYEKARPGTGVNTRIEQ